MTPLPSKAENQKVVIAAWPENNQRPRRGIDYSSFSAKEVYDRDLDWTAKVLQFAVSRAARIGLTIISTVGILLFLHSSRKPEDIQTGVSAISSAIDAAPAAASSLMNEELFSRFINGSC